MRSISLCTPGDERIRRFLDGLPAAGGFAAWALLAMWPGTARLGLLEKLFLLAPLTIVPLALPLIRSRDRTGRDPAPYRLALLAQPICAGLAGVSFFVPAGVLAALLTCPWFVVTLLLGAFGLTRLLPRGLAPVEELCIDVGLIYLPVGGGWLLLSRLGAQPMRFDDIVVLLTAIHFHYAGFAAPVFAGLLGRVLSGGNEPQPRLYRPSCLGIILGTPLLAAGITLSPGLEAAAALILASSLALIAGLAVTSVVVRPTGPIFARILLGISAASVLAAMALACLYVLGEFLNEPKVDIPDMAAIHGLANSLGFSLCGLLAFRLLAPESRGPCPGIPFSRLVALGVVGADYFHRIGAVAGGTQAPSGLVDDLAEYRRADFSPAALQPEVRAFYEKTSAYSLVVVPHWKRGFRLAGVFYRFVADRLGQMCLPTSTLGAEQEVHSVILPLTDELDGRSKVRAWVRTYARTKKPVYVAAYSSHVHEAVTYMNIAFPMPGGNVTSVLYLEAVPRGGSSCGLRLSTWPISGLPAGDQGVYLANRILPIRLPINETIEVWAAPRGGKATVLARHDMWIFGLHFLTLDYLLKS